MRRFLSVAWILAGFTVSITLCAQPADWGDVPRHQLEMKTFPADSNASAVVLSDVGEVYFDGGGSIIFKRHRRIKILTEGGYDWGTVELSYRDEDNMERILDIDGQTFTHSESGQIERHKLDGDDIFEEDVDGSHERKRFTLPALEPGAVIEYRYKKRIDSPILMPEWSFQTSEPTLWSEYKVKIPTRFFQYARIMTGAPDFHIQKEDRGHGILGPTQEYRWVMKDVPALREEPFITTLKDYRDRIALQLQNYESPEGGREQFMTSWSDLAEELLDRSDFGGQLDSGGDVRIRAELVAREAQDPLEKLKAIYNYARTKIEWDGSKGIIPDRDVDDVLEAQSGSAPEIALLLAAMLRNVGLEAHPVLISTRDHGQLQPVYPYLGQFNSVVTYVKAGKTPYLLDATDPHRPYDMLPVRALNGMGWKVTEGGDGWLRISPPPYRRQINVVGTLSADGTVEAKIRVSDAKYSALKHRQELQEHGERSFVREVLLDGLSDVEVQADTIRHEADVENPLTSKVTFRAPAYAQSAGDFLYVNPILLDRKRENPFRAPSRTFPIDFAYPRDLRYILSLQLPDGFTVQEKPGDMQIPMPDQGGGFQRLTQIVNGRLTLRTRFVVGKTRFEPAYYEELQDFYERVVAAQAEQIVLKRTPEPTDVAEEASAGGEGR